MEEVRQEEYTQLEEVTDPEEVYDIIYYSYIGPIRLGKLRVHDRMATDALMNVRQRGLFHASRIHWGEDQR